jgi:hypothetical protein
MFRVIQIKNTDSLTKLLKAGGAAQATTTLDKLQRLNPHANLSELKAGTVLLMPDLPHLKAGEADSVAAETFDAFASDATTGLKASSERLRAGAAQREAERKEVTAVFNSAAIKQAFKADPALREQADAALERFKIEQKEATESLAQLESMNAALADELGQLAKLFK